jgi:hypothetical protein
MCTCGVYLMAAAIDVQLQITVTTRAETNAKSIA